MALALSRNARGAQSSFSNRVWSWNKSPIVSAEPVRIVQVATLKHMGTEKYPYVKPFPYWRKRFNTFYNLTENSNKRMSEQSKVIVIEGNAGVGKHKFAERLAKEFDLMYFRGLESDDLWVQAVNGFNRRDLNDAFDDEECKVLNFNDLYNDPNLGNDRIKLGQAARMQFECLSRRTMQYTNMLLHLLSTGQGIVTVRTPYTDEVFTRAMRDMGWLSRAYTKHHLDHWDFVQELILMPHLNIYLHAPVDVCLDNIRKRHEQDPKYPVGPNLNEEYLTLVEKYYRKFLDDCRLDHEVMELDWAEAADESELDVIWEFISKINLEPEDFEGTRYHDWHKMIEDKTGERRLFYTDRSQVQSVIGARSIVNRAPEFQMHYTAQDQINEVYSQHPMTQYNQNYFSTGWFDMLFRGAANPSTSTSHPIMRKDIRFQG